LAFSRNAGGSSLRKLSFSERAGLLAKIADVLVSRRDRWFEIARINSGNTKADAAIDIDGATGPLKYFAKVGAGLGESKLLVDGTSQGWLATPTFRRSTSEFR
jgi:3,4-dehydroadipyl-CoA semialdehyde dehydrogenase